MKTLLVMLSIIFSGFALADQTLAQKYACLACHAIDKKLVGPSYKDVAAKYKNDKQAVKYLVTKVKKGGSGVWGPIPMPANAHVSDKDIETIVKWVLTQ